MRAIAKTISEKDFYTLMNNSVYGKTIENVRNRSNVKLVGTEKQARKEASKPEFKGKTEFTEKLAAVYHNKTEVKMDKPIYVGMYVLDYSRRLMYDFHYNYVQKNMAINQNYYLLIRILCVIL